MTANLLPKRTRKRVDFCHQLGLDIDSQWPMASNPTTTKATTSVRVAERHNESRSPTDKKRWVNDDDDDDDDGEQSDHVNNSVAATAAAGGWFSGCGG
ncbi:hypothetical protein KIN20_017959 [Parelaphostrongylus tenuis]|uniref:Uncharacterized protein n=1 Tax=Parelaphostrongylus tenuis TaxID=148309 RepID=A0AAD5N3Q3_PARTN|nr:hypothetical protein KIN20_017959 [Parelaphostrongylus tenuis]